MASYLMSRREVLATSVAAGALALPFRKLGAQTRTLTAMSFPGPFEEAARTVIAPVVRRATGATVVISPISTLDVITKLAASRDNPPFDYIVLDEANYFSAVDLDLLAPLPMAQLAHAKDLPERFVYPGQLGIYNALQLYGIAYNPKRITTPPTSWNDLFKPEYKGRVGWQGPETSIGAAMLVEFARMRGGNEKNLEPGWAMLRDLMSNVATLSATSGALAVLFQQGQVDIAPLWLSVVEPVRARGADVALARPETGWGFLPNSGHVVKHSKNAALAAAYVDATLDPEVQNRLARSPYHQFPSNPKVRFDAELSKIARDIDDLTRAQKIDWKAIAPQRKDMVARFNREYRRG
jgi:putative spermidine/putrescine transport system substrate-binding protein